MQQIPPASGLDETKEESSSYIAYIGLGSNLGDREAYLRLAVEGLQADPEVEVIRCSDLYETDPVGYVDQDSFLNMAVAVRTARPPHALYRLMADIERRLGRTRDIRWGPRTLDLDLLWIGQELDTPELTVPHPRMWERAFVLIPLLEVIGDPMEAESIARHLEKLQGKEGVRRWKKISWLNA